jgi:hypothetical protein
MRITRLIKSVPFLGDILSGTQRRILRTRDESFRGSADYWERRYASSGTSGDGSYGKLAEFKARVINEFVRENAIDYVIEFGCGDGNQLTLAKYPKYLGFDVSETALIKCRKLFSGDTTKVFKSISDYSRESAPLTLSLDVIYHLVEDDVYREYMTRLFSSSYRYVIIYSRNTADTASDKAAHVRNRKFTEWIAQTLPEWKLIQHVPNEFPYVSPVEGSLSDFYIYQKV